MIVHLGLSRTRCEGWNSPGPPYIVYNPLLLNGFFLHSIAPSKKMLLSKDNIPREAYSDDLCGKHELKLMATNVHSGALSGVPGRRLKHL
jgi:hypothetical protein